VTEVPESLGARAKLRFCLLKVDVKSSFGRVYAKPFVASMSLSID